MNVSSQKFVIPTKGPMRLPDGAGAIVIAPALGLLILCAVVWIGFTLAPLVRGCWA